MQRVTVEFVLNGEKRKVDVMPTDILLEVLREKLGIKSPKYGCGRGDCGTCTIILNGKTVRACLILAVEVDGQEIVTLEGLPEEKMKPLWDSFLEHSSFQCGFCTPGMIMSVYELLEKKNEVSEEDVKEALSGNLCRCTGYTPIIEAVVEAARNYR